MLENLRFPALDDLELAAAYMALVFCYGYHVLVVLAIVAHRQEAFGPGGEALGA